MRTRSLGEPRRLHGCCDPPSLTRQACLISPQVTGRKRVAGMRQHTQWRWHLDEVYVKINGVQHYLWRAVDHEGEVLESFVTKERDKAAALLFIKKAMKRHGRPQAITSDGLRSYGAALKRRRARAAGPRRSAATAGSGRTSSPPAGSPPATVEPAERVG